MSALKEFMEETHEQIINNTMNNSTAKQSFTFTKQKRFLIKNSNCPYVSYYNDPKSKHLKRGNAGLGSAERKLFIIRNQGPNPTHYSPKYSTKKNSMNFSKSREEIEANSYINKGLFKNPGPGNYESQNNKSISYTMRPQTSKERNCTYECQIDFIRDQEQAQKPGPGAYDNNIEKIQGKNLISKFKSSLLGGSLTNKSNRFKTEGSGNPTSWSYQKSLDSMNKTGIKFGREYRYAFTDKKAQSSFTPGPGNYQLPCEFGHYRKRIHN